MKTHFIEMPSVLPPHPRFTVYVVIPLHPEGMATDSAIQEMLHWQKRTMHMMYSRIAHALHAKGIK